MEKLNDGDLKIRIDEILSLAGETDNPRMLTADVLLPTVRILQNYLIDEENYNANVLISADLLDVSKLYGQLLIKIMNYIIPESCVYCSENDFYAWKDFYNTSLAEKSNKTIIVTDVTMSGNNIGFLYDRLSDIANDKKFGYAVIMCVDKETLEEGIKKYTLSDSILFYNLCRGRDKLSIPDYNEEMVYKSIINRLGKKFTLTNAFKEMLEKYIRAVYPGATYSGTAFVDDFIYSRLLPIIKSQSDTDSNVLKAKHILDIHSEKLANLLETEEKNINNEYIIPDIKSEESHFGTLEGGKNVLILSMSTLNGKDPNYYSYAEDNNYIMFKGVSQLEPGTKFFISQLAKAGKKADKIIVLTTPESVNTSNRFGKSALEEYCRGICEFIENGIDEDDELESINEYFKSKYSDWSRDFENVKEAIKELYSPIDSEKTEFEKQFDRLKNYVDVKEIRFDEEALQNLSSTLNDLVNSSGDEGINLFLDLQGGSRTFMFTMFATITLFRDRAVNVCDLFATSYDKTKSIHPIQILNDEYAIIDLVSGIRAFTRYGKVDELKRFIENRGIKDESKEKELLEIMTDIDGNMQINNPNGFADELKKLSDTESNLLDPDNYKDSQFKLIVEDLKDVYEPILPPEDHTVLDVIKWFAEKAFLTSALTFIEDKTPYYMMHGEDSLIKVSYSESLSDDEICKKTNGQSYYRKENNIFNSGFNKIINSREKDFYQRVSLYWAEKISDSFGADIEFKDGIGTISDRIIMFSELSSDLLRLENKLSSLSPDIWDEMDGDTLRKNLNLKTMPELTSKLRNANITKKKKLRDVPITKNEILRKLDDDEKRSVRLKVLSTYLKNREFNLDIQDESESKIIKFIFATTINILLFEQDANNCKQTDIVNKVLCPISDRIQDSLPNTSQMIALKNKLSINDEGDICYDGGKITERYPEFAFELWHAILDYIHHDDFSVIDTRINDSVSTQETVFSAENELSSVFMELQSKKEIKEDESLETLFIRYANAYANCRKEKTNLEKNKCTDRKDKDCSIKNKQLYLEISDDYVEIYKDFFFYTDSSGILNTMAGLKNGEYDGWLTICFDMGFSDEKRTLVDILLRFYKAFKEERNITNHAVENDDNHINYLYTKEAILVFVELCKIIEKMD